MHISTYIDMRGGQGDGMRYKAFEEQFLEEVSKINPSFIKINVRKIPIYLDKLVPNRDKITTKIR